jgi:hypothetical protein
LTLDRIVGIAVGVDLEKKFIFIFKMLEHEGSFQTVFNRCKSRLELFWESKFFNHINQLSSFANVPKFGLNLGCYMFIPYNVKSRCNILLTIKRNKLTRL